jgi:hypothetical protein
MPALFRARVTQIVDAFTAPFGDRDVIVDRAELIDALVALVTSEIRELVRDVYRERAD